MKQRLFITYNTNYNDWEERLNSVTSACYDNIEVVLINENRFDYGLLNTLTVCYSDMYINLTPKSYILESFFLERDVTSFNCKKTYQKYVHSSSQYDISLLNNDHIQVPKTILRGSSNRELLASYVSYLNGFPIILKIEGGTLGVGVIKIESWQNLLSTVDYLDKINISFQLKEFISNIGTIRVVVLGKEVICSTIRENLFEDFRCSSPLIRSESKPYNCDCTLIENAIKVTDIVNHEFLGLDFVKSNNEYYLLEVNAPHNFIIPANINRVNIGKRIVDYLYDKSNKQHQKPL